MKRQHLNKLAEVLAEEREHIQADVFWRLVKAISEVCSEVNPAFDQRKFRELALAEVRVKE